MLRGSALCEEGVGLHEVYMNVFTERTDDTAWNPCNSGCLNLCSNHISQIRSLMGKLLARFWHLCTIDGLSHYFYITLNFQILAPEIRTINQL